ncbi:MAG: beta-propeller fold lactonase family protein [Acidobacteria bacterium]|nr:beta-propeller fold lactonase family protein [Acidobacteriota bacterium]
MKTIFQRLANLKRSQAARLAALWLIILTSHFAGASAASAAPQPRTVGRSFVYTITNLNGDNTIALYERDAQSGQLSFRTTFPTGGRGSGTLIDSQSPLVVNDNGTVLYAVNAASNTISALAIADDGALTVIGTYNSRGVMPSSLALRGDLLYVANKGDAANAPNYAGFRVNADGSLARIKRLTPLNLGDNPTQILFNREGTMVIGLRFGGRLIDYYTVVRASGKLRPRGQLTSPTGPFAGAFNPLNDTQLIVSDARLPGAVSYAINGQGQMQQIHAVSNAPDRAACWIAVHPNGLYVWVSNTGTNTLSLYTINADGTLNLVGNHSTQAFGRAPFEIVLDKSGQFLYQLNVRAGNQSIHVLRVTGNSANAGLEDVATVNLPDGATPAGLVVVE